MTTPLRLGTRGSPLAVRQADIVAAQIEARCGRAVTQVRIKTSGDMIKHIPLTTVGGKGLFVKEIEEALLRDQIDLAVHSIKDLPVTLPEGLHLAAILERDDAHDALVSRDQRPFASLPPEARVGTTSLRRRSQLLHARPDLRITPLRGNLDTRLKKLTREGLDAIVVASAGLRRMGWEDRAAQLLPFEICLPAIGQGAIGVECRVADRDTTALLHALDHEASRRAILAERALLAGLEGGCQVPIAGHARLTDGTLILEGAVLSVDGTRQVRDQLQGDVAQPEALGRRLAEILLRRGAAEILKEVYA